MLAAVGLQAGCVTESIRTADGLPRASRPAPLRTPATGLAPVEMLLLVAPGSHDGDGDGYADTFSVSAYLRAEGEPLMVRAEGDVRFEIDLWPEGSFGSRDATPIARWTFDAAAADEAVQRRAPGWVYQFRLSLAEAGVDDRMSARSADVRGRFVFADGRAIDVSDDVRPVRLGR